MLKIFNAYAAADYRIQEQINEEISKQVKIQIEALKNKARLCEIIGKQEILNLL